MANERRKRQNLLKGTLSSSLSSGGTTMSSSALAGVSGGVASTEHLAITIDPDGAAPEIVYVTALTGGASSATIVRGQEGTSAAAWPSGTAWVHAPTRRDFVGHRTAARTGGDLSLNSTNWANVDTGLDLVLAAAAGDDIEVTLNCLLGGETNDVYLDVVSVVSGSPVNSFGAAAAVTTAPPAYGIAGWYSIGNAFRNPGPPHIYTVQAGDLATDGTITLRLRYATSTAAAHTMYATANRRLCFSAKNLGPALA